MTYLSKFSLALAAGALGLTTACTDPATIGDGTNNTRDGALLGAGLGAALGAIVAGDGNRAKGAGIM